MNPLPNSWAPSISANGRFVAFTSEASDLVPGDTNGFADVFVRDVVAGLTTRVSVDSQGKEASLLACPGATKIESHYPSISDAGARVAFESSACDLAPDPEPYSDIFIHDIKDGQTSAVSVDPQGATAGGVSPSMSGDGRFVAFSNDGSMLAENQTNTQNTKVFVRDLKLGITELVSVASDGADPSTFTYHSSTQERTGGRLLSADGRFVTFRSPHPLVPNDATGTLVSFDNFLRDRFTKRTEKVNVDSYGRPTEPTSRQALISSDGRFVAVDSLSDSDLESDPGDADAFVYDRATGQVDWVSKGISGESSPACGDRVIDESLPLPSIQTLNGSIVAGLSAEGRYAAFFSCSSDFVTNDGSDLVDDLFVADRGQPLSVGELANAGRAQRISLDGDRGFSRTGIAKVMDADSDSRASLDIPLSATVGEMIGAGLSYRPELEDIFLTLELEGMPRTPTLAGATAGHVYGARFVADGVDHEVRISSQGLTANGLTAAVFGLFACTNGPLAPCEFVTQLRGGFGTTGERIVVSLPLGDIGLNDGGSLSEVKAFTALGSYLLGPQKILDITEID